jgi:hypothetical protein
MEWERKMLKACSQVVSRPSSRCRLMSYRPTAAKGPIRANPETSGKTSGNNSYPAATLIATTMAIGYIVARTTKWLGLALKSSRPLIKASLRSAGLIFRILG